MKTEEILGKVDHTQLKAYATWGDIQKLCEEAIRYHTASVCVPPAYVRAIRDTYGEQLTICTVVGFPLGYSVTEAKAAEVECALRDGCDEIDMVVNISDIKNGYLEKVEEEIRTLKKVCGEHILKVIIETCYLTDRYPGGSGLYQDIHRVRHGRRHKGGRGVIPKAYRIRCENQGGGRHFHPGRSGNVCQFGL